MVFVDSAIHAHVLMDGMAAQQIAPLEIVPMVQHGQIKLMLQIKLTRSQNVQMQVYAIAKLALVSALKDIPVLLAKEVSKISR